MATIMPRPTTGPMEHPPLVLCRGADAVANADENGDGQAKQMDASSKDPTSNDASRDATSQDPI